jgi:beta-N-acetylhexosaminidase
VTIDAIVEAVRRGEISEARLDASVRRILAAKARVALPVDTVALFETSTSDLYAAHARLADSIATRSITLVRDERDLLPVRDQRAVLSIVYSERGTDPGVAFERALRAHGIRVETIRLTRNSTAAQLSAAMAAARREERLVVVSSYTQAAPWRGTLGLPTGFRTAVDALAAERPLAYISFGDPYVVRGLPRVATYMLAWSESPASQSAAARALLGQAAITGKLPIRIPPAYEAGFGLERVPLPTPDPQLLPAGFGSLLPLPGLFR